MWCNKYFLYLILFMYFFYYKGHLLCTAWSSSVSKTNVGGPNLFVGNRPNKETSLFTLVVFLDSDI